MKSCVVVLLGLPGAGKTTLASRLFETMTSGTAVVKVFSYDDIVPLKQQVEFVTSKDMKTTRKLLYDSVDECLATSRECVIIVDDNNYYRSMRYEYYRLTAKHKAGFCQIFVHCPVEGAIENNKQRPLSSRVPESVIRRMESRFEAPRDAWENCFQILAEMTQGNLETLISFIQRACENPVLVLETREAAKQERQASRQICSASLVHQADQILRKQIQAIILENPVQAKPRAAKLNLAKKTILQKLKDGEVSLTPNGIQEELVRLLLDISEME